MMIEEKLKKIPIKPGVYLLKDREGKIIYVGKAKILKDRLRSHFKPGCGEDRKHCLMMARVADFETIVTDSEVEALILEANFVKEHRPRYNVNLKDDKSYPFIRVTNEPYARVFVSRKIVRDGSRYFGPYTDVGTMRQLISAIRRIFPIRTCSLQIDEGTIAGKKHRVCLLYHIGKCRGPCEGLIPNEEYKWLVQQVVSFIQGRNNQLLRDLEVRMKTLSGEKQYEEAARLRDQLRSISTFWSKQKVVDDLSIDRDLATIAAEGEDMCGVVFNVRDGKIVNRQYFYLEGVKETSEDVILASFLKQYYLRADYIPQEIVVPRRLDESFEMAEWLSKRKGKRVVLTAPKKGKKSKLMEMCSQNARLLLEELHLQKERAGDWTAPSVKALQKDLDLKHLPKHIEAFDISNIAGQDATASMVVFDNGKPNKGEYRRYKIRRVEGIDDYRMMAEAIERRMARLQDEGKPFPDLILVDGGKGQLSSALGVLNRFGIPDQPILGLAKRLEEIFLPGIPDPQTLSKSSASLRLLQRVRDEAHRFAVQYHRKLRKKRMVSSVLDDIPGIGEKRRNALIKHFGSVQNIKTATVDAIAAVEGMNQKAAERVAEFLKKGNSRKSSS